MGDGVTFRPAGPDDAAAVRELAARAFAGRPPLDPPSPAPEETVAEVAADLRAGSGVVGTDPEGRVVAALRVQPDGDAARLRRVAVDPESHGRGLGTRLALWTQAWLAAGGPSRVTRVEADVRVELPANMRFWEQLGYARVPSREGLPPWMVTYARPLPPALRVAGADAMRALGARVAALLAPGDVVLLHGELGAGKTTLTQGIGAALGVRGAVTSPTFVIAREHPGPVPLVHVDAYRLGGRVELEDLDLDPAGAVTVVEWGEGIAERLAPERLEVRITRPEEPDDQTRVAVLEGFGSRWRDVPLAGAAAPAGVTGPRDATG